MPSHLYRATSIISVQGFSLRRDDLVVYLPETQGLTPYLDDDNLNPQPVHLPQAVLTTMVTKGLLEIVPPPAAIPADFNL